jgi:mono/diheme cytochrome c family protein
LTQTNAGKSFFEQAVRRFWIIKNGIKDSGMPAWSKAGVDDAAIWDLVALVQQLPTLSQTDYSTLVESSEGHVHGGADPEHHHHDDDD